MPHYCKQIKFRKFVQIPFNDLVPQFVIDFFRHMTNLDFNELVAFNQKQNPIQTKRESIKNYNPDQSQTSKFSSGMHFNQGGGEFEEQ